MTAITLDPVTMGLVVCLTGSPALAAIIILKLFKLINNTNLKIIYNKMLRYSRIIRTILSAQFSTEHKVPTIEVQIPVFPMTKHIVQLTENKFQELAKLDKLHVTTLLRKDGAAASESPLDRYHNINTYCSAILK